MTSSRERGPWNRAGRRSGGQRAARIFVPMVSSLLPDEPTIGPFCAAGQHDKCSGEQCICLCHDTHQEDPDG